MAPARPHRVTDAVDVSGADEVIGGIDLSKTFDVPGATGLSNSTEVTGSTEVDVAACWVTAVELVSTPTTAAPLSR